MKTKRLIRYRDMARLIAAARRTQKDGNPVYVAKLLAEYYGPRRKITNQMRKIVSAELDRRNIPRARRVDRPATFEQGTLNAMTGKARMDVDRDTLECTQYGPGLTSGQNLIGDSIPGVLGGMTAESLRETQSELDKAYSDVIDISLPDDVQAKCDAYAARLERVTEIDRELSKMADDGNYSALGLLMHRLRTR